jgi:hypothetical protein
MLTIHWLSSIKSVWNRHMLFLQRWMEHRSIHLLVSMAIIHLLQTPKKSKLYVLVASNSSILNSCSSTIQLHRIYAATKWIRQYSSFLQVFRFFSLSSKWLYAISSFDFFLLMLSIYFPVLLELIAAIILAIRLLQARYQLIIK